MAAELSACATKAGWTVTREPWSRPTFVVLTGHKRFEGRWVANLNIYIGNDVRHRSSVQVDVGTDPV